MRIKYLLLIILALFFMAISCQNTARQSADIQKAPVDQAAIERENLPPDAATLEEMETVTEKVKSARKKGQEMGCPSIFPADWKAAESLYAQAEQRKKTSTLRETQESATRYSLTADAFDSVNSKALYLLAPEKKQELAEAKKVSADYIATEKEQEKTDAIAKAAAEKERAKAEATAKAKVAQVAVVSVPSKTEPIVVTPKEPIKAEPAVISKPPAAVTYQGEVHPLPAQYTVRPWNISGDSLHNIAGRPWVYNDPEKWRLLYEANKSRMPEPDNPALIEPDMVLDIPSIKDEFRQGMWAPNRNYPTVE